MEWKLSVFPEKKWKQRGNMKTEMEICKMEVEMEFLCGNGNKNGTVFSNGTCMEMELLVSVNMEFLFLLYTNSCFVAQPPKRTQ